MTGRDLKALALRLRREVRVYARVVRDPRTPWAARVLLGAAVLYLLSPIDLVPDILPVIGQLDDLIVVPALAWAGLKMIPGNIVEEHRAAVERGDE